MRYLFLAASLLFLSIGNGLAQNNTFKQELSVGASFGMNFSSITLFHFLVDFWSKGYG